jgi:hypothetical protein
VKLPENNDLAWWEIYGNFEGRLFRPEVSEGDESEFDFSRSKD